MRSRIFIWIICSEVLVTFAGDLIGRAFRPSPCYPTLPRLHIVQHLHLPHRLSCTPCTTSHAVPTRSFLGSTILIGDTILHYTFAILPMSLVLILPILSSSRSSFIRIAHPIPHHPLQHPRILYNIIRIDIPTLMTGRFATSFNPQLLLLTTRISSSRLDHRVLLVHCCVSSSLQLLFDVRRS